MPRPSGEDPGVDLKVQMAARVTGPRRVVTDRCRLDLSGREVLIADATVNFVAFGYYGPSLWAVPDAWSVDMVLAEK